jgi:hypothetical protein
LLLIYLLTIYLSISILKQITATKLSADLLKLQQHLSIATEIVFSYFASFKLSTMVLSIAANYSRQITATKPTLLHSKSVFKKISYKFTVHELHSNKFQRGGGRHLIVSKEDRAGGQRKRGRDGWGRVALRTSGGGPPDGTEDDGQCAARAEDGRCTKRTGGTRRSRMA